MGFVEELAWRLGAIRRGRTLVVAGDPEIRIAIGRGIAWNGWLPPRTALQRAVRWLAETLDQTVPDSPYR